MDTMKKHRTGMNQPEVVRADSGNVSEPEHQLSLISSTFLSQPESFELDFTDKIICGDCEEVLKQLPDNCVDLIVTSPPYADQRKSTYGGVPAPLNGSSTMSPSSVNKRINHSSPKQTSSCGY
jgi:hypothetical protein